MGSVKRFLLLVPIALFMVFTSSCPSLSGEITDAVKARDVVRVSSLLAAGADVNEKVRGDFPLNVAALYGPAEMVTVLLAAGAKLEQPGRDGLQPLHNVVIIGNTSIVALLIQKGAALDAKDKLGRTPLVSFAVTGGGNIEIARLLLAAGASPDIESAKEDDSPTALQYAAETGNAELVKLLLAAHVDVNHQNVWGWSSLHQAVTNDRPVIARLLIAAGADVNLVNKLGNTPLFMAPNDALRKLLIEAGAK